MLRADSVYWLENSDCSEVADAYRLKSSCHIQESARLEYGTREMILLSVFDVI